MKTQFLSERDTVRVMTFNPSQIHDNVPVQVYTVDAAPNVGYFLRVHGPKLDEPTKIYGDLSERTNRVINTFQDFDKSLGVLLTGEKGTGKTLLLSHIANQAMVQLNLPVVMVRTPFYGEDFEKFLKDIGPCILMFDEFGKMYKASYRNQETDGPNQNKLLSLLDGVDKTKRLILLSENSEYDISEFMLNRPSRIYYHFKYDRMPEESIEAYLNEFDLQSDQRSDLLAYSRTNTSVTFDILNAIVTEMIRYNSDLPTALAYLNIESNARDVYLDIRKVEWIGGKDDDDCYLDDSDDPSLPSIILRGVVSREMVRPMAKGSESVNIEIDRLVDAEKKKYHSIPYSIDLYSYNIVYEDKTQIVFENEGFRVVASPALKKWRPTHYDAF